MRVVTEPILALTSQGAPIAVAKGTVLFGPVGESGEFVTMMIDAEPCRCHISEVIRYSCEIEAASDRNAA